MTGHNTDRIGFRRSFEENLGASAVAGKTALLIGAGGAGRAVAFALLDLGADTLLVHDQDGARAGGLVDAVASHFGSRRVRLETTRPLPWRRPRGWQTLRRSACAASPATRCRWGRSRPIIG